MLTRALLTLSLLLTPFAGLTSLADDKTVANPGPVATLTIHNRSEYKMAFAMWGNGKSCTEKLLLNPAIDINAAEPRPITVPAKKMIAVGVGIFDMRDKTPVVCDYIVSFTLQPSAQYLLKYDIHNRRCFAQLFRSENSVYTMILPGEKEDLLERVAEFGWDQFEPACAE